MAEKLTKWDLADNIRDREDIAAYLDAALEDGDPQLFKSTLDAIARSKGMAQIAAETGMSRTSLYKALAPDSNPRLDTLKEVLKTLGLRLSVVEAALKSAPAPRRSRRKQAA
jgi:probable addiction module antidote protein